MRVITLLFLLLITTFIKAQTYTISGSVQSEFNTAIPFSNIISNEKTIYAVADINGKYSITNVESGSYTFIVSAVGYNTVQKTISISKNTIANFVLTENIEALDDVIVKGKSQSKKQNEKAISITSIGTQRVIEQSLGAEELLKQSTGVVVRQSGGLGSNVNINLNGLSQRAVRIFYDGIPLEVFGGGLQVNTIPVDALERIDVYKGVIPIDVGTDALGGGINLVPLRQNKEYLRASFSTGSFNTQRVTLNGRKSISDKISVSGLAYFNYSDNDYVLRNIESAVPAESGLGFTNEIIDARAFHNKHVSGYIEGALRVQDLSWVDRLDISAAYTANDDEVQNGLRVSPISIGEAERKRQTFFGKLDYRKKLLKDKLDLRYYGVLSRSKINVNDSTSNTYNWLGNIIGPNANGTEFAVSPTLREGINLSTSHRVIAKYNITDYLNVKVSDFYRRTEIDGEDPVGNRITINNEEIDPNTIPSILSQNILGAELEAHFFDKTLTAQVFYKNYDYQAESIDFLAEDVTQLPIRNVTNNSNGYGFALKYELGSKLFFRSSFERALRMPTSREVFGDFVTILPNFELRPELSNNVNLGINYTTDFRSDGSLTLGADAFLRNREDLIRADAGITTSQFVNEDEVDGRGIEVYTKISPIKNLRLTGNFTVQSNEIASVPENLELFWNYLVVDRYSINEVSDLDTANPDFIIPTQRIHNTGMTYRFKEKGVSVSLNINNIFNEEAFDNFRVPRPGINYTFKINYSIF